MKHLNYWLFLCVLYIPLDNMAQYRKTKTPTDIPGSNGNTIQYTPIRNEPARSGIFGVILSPILVDASRQNVSLAACSVDFFYTYRSQLRISGGYSFTYLSSISGKNHKGEPYSPVESYGVAVEPKRSTRYELMVSPTISSWQAEDDYHIILGRYNYNTIAVTRIRANVLRSITARLGIMADEQFVESEKGLPFQSNTPVYEYIYKGATYPLRPDNLDKSNSMLRSNAIVFGIGYTTFRDIKLSINDDRYRGRRQEKSQTDLFLDLLYAHRIELQDVTYYHSLQYPTNNAVSGHLPQRLDMTATPLSKFGFRLGYQFLNLYKPWFGTQFRFELGARPGFKDLGISNRLYGRFSWGLIFGGRVAKK